MSVMFVAWQPLSLYLHHLSRPLLRHFLQLYNHICLQLLHSGTFAVFTIKAFFSSSPDVEEFEFSVFPGFRFAFPVFRFTNQVSSVYSVCSIRILNKRFCGSFYARPVYSMGMNQKIKLVQ